MREVTLLFIMVENVGYVTFATANKVTFYNADITSTLSIIMLNV